MSGEKVHPLEWQHFEEDIFRKDDPTGIYAKYFHITIPSFKSVTGWPSCLSDFSFASFTKILQYRSASSCDRPTKTFPKAPTTTSYFIRQCL
jgi:hypothetical protein